MVVRWLLRSKNKAEKQRGLDLHKQTKPSTAGARVQVCVTYKREHGAKTETRFVIVFPN